MHQHAFGGRAPPAPAGEAYSAPPDPLAELRGRSWERGRGGRGKEREEGEKERGRLPMFDMR